MPKSHSPDFLADISANSSAIDDSINETEEVRNDIDDADAEDDDDNDGIVIRRKKKKKRPKNR